MLDLEEFEKVEERRPMCGGLLSLGKPMGILGLSRSPRKVLSYLDASVGI